MALAIGFPEKIYENALATHTRHSRLFAAFAFIGVSFFLRRATRTQLVAHEGRHGLPAAPAMTVVLAPMRHCRRHLV